MANEGVAALPDFGSGPIWILDGALATELEARGCDLNDPLWSARVLAEAPERIEAVHYDYFAAGADVATTASYQVSFEGLAACGLGRAQVAELLRRSVTLAQQARDRFLAGAGAAGRRTPLVAASVGPYGAMLHDGAEYRGDYGFSVAELMAWHRPRLELLADAGADLLACETIPCLAEAEALVRLLDDLRVPAWLSVSCHDGARTNHGEPITEVAALAEASPWVAAVGINCTPPRFVESLLLSARTVTTKPLLCYPNSGELWDAANQCWLPGADDPGFGAAPPRWVVAGARLVGGCCRTGPADIAALRATLLDAPYALSSGTTQKAGPFRTPSV